jgi:hypothetical protein
MATAARLSAAVSVLLAVGLAASTPSGEGSGIVALVGWTGVAVLVIGLVFGIRGSITAAAVAFVIRVGVDATLPADLTIPIWVSALFIVLMVEFGAASLTFRSRPADPIHVVGRALAAGIAAMGITLLLSVMIGVADVTGILVRAIGVGAVVVAAGWVTWTWRRSGLSG